MQNQVSELPTRNSVLDSIPSVLTWCLTELKGTLVMRTIPQLANDIIKAQREEAMCPGSNSEHQNWEEITGSPPPGSVAPSITKQTHSALIH